MTLYCSSTRCLLKKLCKKNKIQEVDSDKTTFHNHYENIKRSKKDPTKWVCPFFKKKEYTQEELHKVHGPNTFRTMDGGQFVIPRVLKK